METTNATTITVESTVKEPVEKVWTFWSVTGPGMGLCYFLWKIFFRL